MKIPKKGFYYHYKHDPKGLFNNYAYEVIGLARNTESKLLTVLYRPLYENTWLKPTDFCSRPYEMFIENVEVNNLLVPRFKIISKPLIIKKLKLISKKIYKN